jgi:hypothetical protein
MKEDVEETVARHMRDPGVRQEWLRQDSLIYGGLTAGSVAVVQPFLTATTHDLASMIAIVSFAIAIPLLAGMLMVTHQEAFRHRRVDLMRMSVAKVVGQGLAVLGVTAAFWHVAWFAGVAVIVSALVAVGVHSAGYTRLEGLSGPSGN